MSSQYLLTVIGDDRPGLTERLAAAVMAAGGSWQEGHLSHLGGKFVGAVLVRLDASGETALRDALAPAADEGLRVELVRAAAEPAPEPEVALAVTSQDRPGIVLELSALLSRLGVNIVELETGTEPSAWSGAAMFRAQARLSLPPAVSRDRLQAELETLSGDLMVDFGAD